jgi:mono/diheme cytochrome c family protein
MMKTVIQYGTLCLVALTLGSGAFAQGSGADIYTAKCKMCHGADGLGTPTGKAMKAEPFNSPDIVKKTDAELIAATTTGKNKMPAYSGKLSETDIKAVVGYIRTLQK